MKSKLTKDESKKLLKEWKQHLANSRLNDRDLNKRAREFTRKGMKPNEHST
jgi:hypothetical protein